LKEEIKRNEWGATEIIRIKNIALGRFTTR